VPFDFIPYNKWVDGLTPEYKNEAPGLVNTEQYAQSLRKGLQDNFGKNIQIPEYGEYLQRHPTHNMYNFKQYLTFLANTELSRLNAAGNENIEVSTIIDPPALKQETINKQKTQTFGNTNVLKGTQQMFCVSVPYRRQGLCINVDENDKWGDFQRKISEASGIPVDDQRILVGHKLQHTIDSLRGWQMQNHGYTRVMDARTLRKRKIAAH